VRDVELEAAQRSRLLKRVRLGPVVAGERKAAKARETRRGYQEEGRRLVYVRDSTYTAGCMLYWAEEAKLRNTVKLTNTDPGLLSYFVGFLRLPFGVLDERFRVAVQPPPITSIDRTRSSDSGLSDSASTSAHCEITVNTYSKYSQKKRMNKLPYGTTAVVVHDTRIVQTIFGSIQELGGFDQPEWLD
jgi:hypothetical protein